VAGIGVAVAGNEVHDLDGLLAFLRDRAADLRDLGGAGERCVCRAVDP
jgi:hypothetical protein